MARVGEATTVCANLSSATHTRTHKRHARETHSVIAPRQPQGAAPRPHGSEPASERNLAQRGRLDVPHATVVETRGIHYETRGFGHRNHIKIKAHRAAGGGSGPNSQRKSPCESRRNPCELRPKPGASLTWQGTSCTAAALHSCAIAHVRSWFWSVFFMCVCVCVCVYVSTGVWALTL